MAGQTVFDMLAAVEAAALAGITPGEVASFDRKEAEARALLAGDTAPQDTAMLSVEAGIVGETEAALATRIVARADALATLAARIAGLRRKTQAAIAAATDEAQIAAAVATLQAAVGQMRGQP
jgi:hypothetical protein